MYNVRRKLWILTVLLFAVSAVMLKFFPSSDNNNAIATPASAQQAESGTSTVFSDGSTERFVAHRGYSNYAPENSIPAFELAGKIGFWGIETQWEKISGIVSQYFLEKTGVYHYLSMAKGNYREYLKTDEVKLKKYFYVIRPILACKWILDKKTAPPMLFSELMNECLDDELKPEINRLLEIKKQTSELGKGKRIDVINDYIEKELAEIEKKADMIENKYNNWEILNKIFLEILEQ